MCAVHAPRFDKWGAVGSGSTTELVGAELVSFRTRFGLDVISTSGSYLWRKSFVRRWPRFFD